MGGADIVVIAAAVLILAGLGWFFFGPRARRVRGAGRRGAAGRGHGAGRLQPEVIRVRQGVPVELIFDRQESGDCTSRVVFPDFQVSAALPAYQRTTVRLDPGRGGAVRFRVRDEHGARHADRRARRGGDADDRRDAGRGRLAGAAAAAEADGRAAAPVTTARRQRAEAQDAEAAERRAEIADLARRVIVGAVLTLPVLFAVMATTCSGPPGCRACC